MKKVTELRALSGGFYNFLDDDNTYTYKNVELEKLHELHKFMYSYEDETYPTIKEFTKEVKKHFKGAKFFGINIDSDIQKGALQVDYKLKGFRKNFYTVTFFFNKFGYLTTN